MLQCAEGKQIYNNLCCVRLLLLAGIIIYGNVAKPKVTPFCGTNLLRFFDAFLHD